MVAVCKNNYVIKIKWIPKISWNTFLLCIQVALGWFILIIRVWNIFNIIILSSTKTITILIHIRPILRCFLGGKQTFRCFIISTYLLICFWLDFAMNTINSLHIDDFHGKMIISNPKGRMPVIANKIWNKSIILKHLS